MTLENDTTWNLSSVAPSYSPEINQEINSSFPTIWKQTLTIVLVAVVGVE